MLRPCGVQLPPLGLWPISRACHASIAALHLPQAGCGASILERLPEGIDASAASTLYTICHHTRGPIYMLARPALAVQPTAPSALAPPLVAGCRLLAAVLVGCALHLPPLAMAVQQALIMPWVLATSDLCGAPLAADPLTQQRLAALHLTLDSLPVMLAPPQAPTSLSGQHQGVVPSLPAFLNPCPPALCLPFACPLPGLPACSIAAVGHFQLGWALLGLPWTRC